MSARLQAGRARNILVVDDDPISRGLVALLLGAEGHHVTGASSGQEALRAVSLVKTGEKKDQLNAILVDLRMPGLCGGKLAERLRTRAGQDVRIFAMSASEPVSTAQYDGFLRKPIDPALLEMMLSAQRASNRPAIAATCENPPIDGKPVLNETIYARLEEMMPRASLLEIFKTCFADLRGRLPVMAACLQSGDGQALRQAAHTVKGGCSMIGASRLAAIAARLESSSYDFNDGNTMLEELSTGCDELERILLERQAKSSGD